MGTEFETLHNHHEQAVFTAVLAAAPRFEHMREPDMLADIACVALNRLPPRYIRHTADFSFYLTDRERADNEAAIREAVDFAYQFVQAKVAMCARR